MIVNLLPLHPGAGIRSRVEALAARSEVDAETLSQADVFFVQVHRLFRKPRKYFALLRALGDTVHDIQFTSLTPEGTSHPTATEAACVIGHYAALRAHGYLSVCGADGLSRTVSPPLSEASR